MSRYSQAKALFKRAWSVDRGSREEFVRNACDGDCELEAEVLELLRVGDELGEPDETCLGLDADGPDPLVGRDLGDCRIVKRIGAGGMGVVYLAEQGTPRRFVALKLLRHFGATARIEKRFRAEADLLARLEHPAIARIFTAGTFEIDGQQVPYIAMEHVRDAAPITAFVDERGLDRRARLSLFLAVCDAVHHGHLKGVIHRDLKPENILVDADGHPKLIDFGVARLIDTEAVLTTLRTEPGQIVGTLQYICPEQCDRPDDLDTRGDVYSLGVVLYELLCGQPPYDLAGDSIYTAVRRVREEAPLSPRRLDPSVNRDLETIVMAALEKDRDKRIASVEALAEDVRCYLQGSPISLRAPSPWRRLGQAIGRHPVRAVALLCLVIAATTLLSTFIVVHHVRATPYLAQAHPRGTSIELVSRSREVLHSWPTEQTRPPVLTERPSWLGGGSVVVSTHIPRSSKSKKLDLFVLSASAPYEEVWSTRGQPIDLPTSMPSRSEVQFAVDLFSVDDFLPELPGREILVVQRFIPYSPSAIRVVDLGGTERFRVWHDGGIESFSRLEDSTRVVFTALNSECDWAARGIDIAPAQWPAVVFALELADGHLGKDWLVEDGTNLDRALVWYSWLGPAESLPRARPAPIECYYATGDFADGRHVQVGFAGLDLVLILDRNGHERQRWVRNEYRGRAEKGELPPEGTLRLLPYRRLPPRKGSK